MQGRTFFRVFPCASSCLAFNVKFERNMFKKGIKSEVPFVSINQ